MCKNGGEKTLFVEYFFSFFHLFPYSAEGVQQFPEVLNRTPSEVEEAIYSKSDNNKVQHGRAHS